MSDSKRFGPELSDYQKAQILDEISEHIPVLINVSDVQQGRFTYVSAAWEDLTGMPVDTWLRDPEAWVEMMHPEDREQSLTLAEGGKERSQPSKDVRILHQDGTIHWIHGWVAPVMEEGGTPLRVLGVATDITKRKEVEADLRQTHLALEQKLRAQAIELQGALEQLQRSNAELLHSREQAEEGLRLYRSLTPREKEVFDFVVRGFTNKDTGEHLDIAEATVKIHRRRVMAKMEVDSVAGLSALAVRAGLMEDPAD